MARDKKIIAQALSEQPYIIDQINLRDLTIIERIIQKLRLIELRRRTYELSIFIQQPEYWWIPYARRNCVIPNQEWFSQYGIELLHRMDEVWCKTREAQRIFSKLGCKTIYIGFTSENQYIPSIDNINKYQRFLHLAGGSIWKGTDILIETWLKHDDWPHLTVVSHTPLKYDVSKLPDNIEVINNNLSSSEIKHLQNICGLYIQPTEMEGFGHTLCEAMSTGAVVITTNAAPMNELVSEERGFLIDVASTDTYNLGTRNFVTCKTIELAVEKVINTNLNELAQLGGCGREWFLEQDALFHERLNQAFKSMLSD